MTEKIYCSQCHNSVYLATTATTGGKKRFGNDKVCLYCRVLKKFMPKKQEINHCVHLLPESVDKLLQGTWGANKVNQ